MFRLGVGGTERAAEKLAVGTHRQGHHSDVVALEGGPRAESLRALGIPVTILSENRSNIGSDNFDALVIHSHGLNNEIVMEAMRRSGNPTIAEVNVFSEPSPWSDALHLSLQLSPWALWLYLQRGGDPSRSAVLPYPVESQNFYKDPAAGAQFRAEYGISGTSLVMGRVGQAYEGKWSPWLIHTFRQILHEGVPIHLLLVGAPEEIVSAAAPYVAQGKATVIPRVEGDDLLRGAYNAMDVFAHAARQGESFGYVLAEAALCELPIVTMATPWADNSQGWVAGSSALVTVTPDGFTGALKQAIGGVSGVDRNERGQRSRKHILDSFDIDSVVAKLLHYLSESPPRTALPSRADLSQGVYQGFDRPLLDRLLARRPNSRIGGPLSGQETWRSYVTEVLNSHGISRNILRRPT